VKERDSHGRIALYSRYSQNGGETENLTKNTSAKNNGKNQKRKCQDAFMVCVSVCGKGRGS
jgi:hypothetical protein